MITSKTHTTMPQAVRTAQGLKPGHEVAYSNTPEQIRAARALLRLEQAELAKRADVSVTPMTVQGVCQALEQAAAEFILEKDREQTGQYRGDERREALKASAADLPSYLAAWAWS